MCTRPSVVTNIFLATSTSFSDDFDAKLKKKGKKVIIDLYRFL